MNIDVLHCLEATGDEAALRYLGNEAIARGWAREGYAEALLRREQEYPTGIATATARVALAHADPEWVVEPSLLAAVLAKPVPFRSMENPSQTIDVDTIFLMLIDTPGQHLTMLQHLVGLIQDPRFPGWRSGLTASQLEGLLAGKEVRGAAGGGAHR